MSRVLAHIWDAELGYTRVQLEQRPPGGPVQIHPETIGADPVWGVWMVTAAGDTGVHVFPHSTLEWRAAEHALDPDDVATIVDVILHERFLPSADDPLDLEHSAAAEILRETRDWPTVWTPGVPDEDRRQACLERIRLVKEKIGRMEAAPRAQRQAALKFVGSPRVAPKDPLEPILSQARLDPVRVQSKRAYLDWRRANLKGPVTPTYSLKPPGMHVGGR